MQKEKIYLEGFNLAGLSTRTNNKNETHPSTSKISDMMQNYWGNKIADQFKDRLDPGVTYCVYTDYESDEHGEYTYFIGEKVKSIYNQNMDHFNSLIIPASHYQKFTSPTGKMPDIIIAAWQEIWKMNSLDFQGQRSYQADFEIYDQRSQNPKQAIVDIYIGIQSTK